ncbi:MAG TPA: hypothetical protein VIL35_14210 [Vicinamibacterales bacterium]
MLNPAYPAARAVAVRVHDYFAKLFERAGSMASSFPPLPEAAAIETVIDTAFWASLRREEGYVPHISLALIAEPHARHPLCFARPLPLVPWQLAKLAPAVERKGIHLGVAPESGRLVVWGTSWTVPPNAVVVEVIAPGLLVVKHRRSEESAKFANIAVLEGDRVKLIDQGVPRQPDCPGVLTSFFGYDSVAQWVDSADILVPFATSMRAHGRGGALLVVPAGSDHWRESIVEPIPYGVEPAFGELAAFLGTPEARAGLDGRSERLLRAIDALAGLTAVDGATIMTTRYELLAFGAKIGRRGTLPPVEKLVYSEPVEGSRPEVIHPVQLGGTRHLSAAQFVQDQQDSVALVASQDGRFTVFTWSPAKRMVVAYRVDSLLL